MVHYLLSFLRQGSMMKEAKDNLSFFANHHWFGWPGQLLVHSCKGILHGMKIKAKFTPPRGRESLCLL